MDIGASASEDEQPMYGCTRMTHLNRWVGAEVRFLLGCIFDRFRSACLGSIMRWDMHVYV